MPCLDGLVFGQTDVTKYQTYPDFDVFVITIIFLVNVEVCMQKLKY